MSREDAYRAVQRNAMAAWDGKSRFSDLLKRDPEISRFLDPRAIDGLFETVADATEEAALNALFQAVTVTGGDRHVLHALPVERTLDLLRG